MAVVFGALTRLTKNTSLETHGADWALKALPKLGDMKFYGQQKAINPMDIERDASGKFKEGWG